MTNLGPRIPRLVPAELDPEQAELYAEIAGGPRASGVQHFALVEQSGALAGPFNALLLAPAVGRAVADLGSAVRYRTTLSPRTRELAILLVAAHWDCAFERYAHEAVGRAVGVTDAELVAARGPRPTCISRLCKSRADQATSDPWPR